MPDRARSEPTWPQWHKDKIDQLRKRTPRPQTRVEASASGGLYSFTDTPGGAPTPALIGTLSIPPGDWVVTAGVYGDYDSISLTLDLPVGIIGGWVAFRPDTSAVAAGTHPPVGVTVDDPSLIDLYAMVDTTPGDPVVASVHLTPQP